MCPDLSQETDSSFLILPQHNGIGPGSWGLRLKGQRVDIVRVPHKGIDRWVASTVSACLARTHASRQDPGLSAFKAS